MFFSICIPTYNRADYLNQCLASLKSLCTKNKNIEICISDNGSEDDTNLIVEKWKSELNIVYHRFGKNQGIPLNFLKVVSLAKGDYVWLLGDDDIVVPNAVSTIIETLKLHSEIDFFLFNAINLSDRSKLDANFKLVNKDAPPVFWVSEINGKVPFRQLIEENITFDHLGGMYLSIFRRSMWNASADKLDQKAIKSKRLFDSHANTFPHVQIFALSFMGSDAFVSDATICYSFSDAREWRPYYPLIRSVRLLESLDLFRLQGLDEGVYHKLKSKSLRYFAEDMLRITFFKKWYWGAEYINIKALIRENIVYSGFWISVASVVLKGCKKIFKHFSGRLK